MGSGWKDHPIVATALAVQARYKQDAADQLAAAIGFFAFLSLVPLLLLAVAAAGFVYADPADQARVALALTEAIPGFEATLGSGEADEGVSALISTVVEQRGTAGFVGIVTLLLAGLRVIASAMAATRVVFRGDTVAGVSGWVRKLTSLVVLGVTALLAVAGSSLAGIEFEAVPRVATVLLSLVISFGLDFLLFWTAYRVLSTTTSMQARQLIPGAILAAAGWTVLKIVGATYVASQVSNANALYGALGGVIALLLLLYLAGRLYLYGAELSAVLVERQGAALEAPWAEQQEGAPTGSAAASGVASTSSGSSSSPGPAANEASGPPPIPRRARASTLERRGEMQPSVETRARLAEADARELGDDPDRGVHARTALGMGLAALALAAGWRFLGPDRE